MDKQKIPQLAYDGAVIDTLWDNHEPAIEWYEKHLSLIPNIRANKTDFRFDYSSELEMMTFYPGMFNLHSVITSKRLVHLFAERGTVAPHVRLCLRTGMLESEHTYLKDINVRVSDIYVGPGGHRYFDFWATAEGTRFTAVGGRELKAEVPRYRDAMIRIGVSDLELSAQWYERYLGFTRADQQSTQEWIKLNALRAEESDGKRAFVASYPIFLEKLPPDSTPGRVDGPVRLYFLIDKREDFDEYHRTLQEAGVWVSTVGDGFGTFHLYDPDGNRLNVWHY